MTEVILLLFIGTILIVLNVNAIKKDKKSFSGTLKDKEDNIKDYQIEIGQFRRELSETVLELQKEIEDLRFKVGSNNNFKKERYDNNLEDKELYTNRHEENSYNYEKKVTKETEEENFEQDFRKELLKGIEVMHNSKLYEQEKNEIKYEDENIVEKVIENNKSSYNSVKVDEIKEMIDNGLSVDEISEKIGIGKGEVLLIKELYTK